MTRATGTAVQEISVEEFDELIENHETLVILDVREPGEHPRARIPRSLNVPLASLAAGSAAPGAIPAGARDKTVVVYCADGGASRQATALLQAQGFQRVYCLSGGLARWRAAGQAVISD